MMGVRMMNVAFLSRRGYYTLRITTLFDHSRISISVLDTYKVVLPDQLLPTTRIIFV